MKIKYFQAVPFYKDENKWETMNLKIIFGIIVLLTIIQFSSAQGLYYALEVQYDSGKVYIKNVDVIFSSNNLENVVNEKYFKTYSVELIDSLGKKEKIFFGILNKLFYDDIALSADRDGFVSGGLREIDNVTLIVYAPYYENVEELIIYDDSEREVARRPIIFLETESESQDNNQSSKNNGKNKNYFIFGVAGVIVLIIIMIYLISRKPKKKK